MANKRSLIIVNPSNDREKKMFDKWKKKCLNENGYGGIKKRVVEVIKEDLKEKTE